MSGGAPGSESSGWMGGSHGGSVWGFFGSLVSWGIGILLGEDADEVTDNIKIEQARKAFEIVGEPGEVETMCQQSYDSQPQLNLYWNADSPFPKLPSLEDDERIQQIEEAIEDEKTERFIQDVVVGVTPPEKTVHGNRYDRGGTEPAEPDVILPAEQ